MGWKGTVRSINAAMRAAERDAKRRQRELERRQKEYAKMLELEQAAYEVDVYENYVERLVSLHKECSAPINWKEVLETPAPLEPKYSDKLEAQAQNNWMSFEPSFFDKLFGKVESKRAILREQVKLAEKEDQRRYEASLQRHEEELIDWRDSQAFAERVINEDQTAYLEALRDLDSFNELAEIGSSVTIEINQDHIIEALFHVHGEKVIPKEQKNLLKSGKLSVKQIPKGKYFELYQDGVCSAVLRIAREVFAILPVDLVIVTAMDELLNTHTGHLEEQPILSVAIPRITLDKLNMDLIDPSDSMRNFVHKMDFKKTQGFQATERIWPTDLETPT